MGSSTRRKMEIAEYLVQERQMDAQMLINIGFVYADKYAGHLYG